MLFIPTIMKEIETVLSQAEENKLEAIHCAYKKDGAGCTILFPFSLIHNNCKQPDRPLSQRLAMHLRQYQISDDD
jgi:hypothetical protein